MALQHAAELAQVLQFFLGEEALVGQYGVKRRAAVALAEHQPVTLGPPGIFGIVAQDILVQRLQDFYAGQGSARMTRLTSVQHIQHIPPVLTRLQL